MLKTGAHPEILEWANAEHQRSTDRLSYWRGIPGAFDDLNEFLTPELLKNLAAQLDSRCDMQFEYPVNDETIEVIIGTAPYVDSMSGQIMMMGCRTDTKSGEKRALFVDCNDDYSWDSDRHEFQVSPGLLLWLASGGLWIAPCHKSFGGRSADADNVISAIKYFTEWELCDPSRTIVAGTGANARLAARIAISQPDMCSDLILENGVFDAADMDLTLDGFYSISDESPINPANLMHPTLFVNNAGTLPNLFEVLPVPGKNQLISVCESRGRSVLDNPMALAFAFNQSS